MIMNCKAKQKIMQIKERMGEREKKINDIGFQYV